MYGHIGRGGEVEIAMGSSVPEIEVNEMAYRDFNS